ncbi:MAG: type II toxin-antitoxin system PemK/MazF family toxin [Acidobacteria bacterium]|nr:type II toxin-antitoxin system PemK/MazF family toxin [Acidobacteriota bacterium]
MIFEPLDVVVVPFPFTNSRATKRRPALIVSSANFNRTHEQSILAMITSAGSDWPSDVAIQGWRQAGLNVPCKVRFKLFTLDNALIVRRLGTLAKQDCEAIESALGHVLASSG